MPEHKFEMIFREPTPPAERGYPGSNPRTEKVKGMIIDYDVAVPMRDGIKIYIDVCRPEIEAKYPVLIAWGPYGKHRLGKDILMGNTGLGEEDRWDLLPDVPVTTESKSGY